MDDERDASIVEGTQSILRAAQGIRVAYSVQDSAWSDRGSIASYRDAARDSGVGEVSTNAG